MNEDIYTLDELIERLENIRDLKDSALNFPKAFLTLAKELRETKKYVAELYFRNFGVGVLSSTPKKKRRLPKDEKT